MPEGHSVHRIAKQFAANFVGTRPELTSPQGRFVEGAALLSGREMTDSRAVGKQMFLEFDESLWLRVHLGIYGAWDFAGDIRVAPGIAIHAAGAKASRFGQTGMQGAASNVVDLDGEDSVTSIGAPRVSRVRMAEEDSGGISAGFPPEPVGAVRVRILNEHACADLRGPTVCEVQQPEEMQSTVLRLGPDPANLNTPEEAQRFIDRAHRSGKPIGLVLMDQNIIAGIGNVYRAEILFRLGIHPHAISKNLSLRTLQVIWDDWAKLLADGIYVGQMMTVDGLAGEAYAEALADRAHRHWVYKRENLPCYLCGATIQLEEFGGRKLYWCPGCQKRRATRLSEPARVAGALPDAL